MVGEDEESDYEECAFAFFSPVEMPGEPATLKEALESSDAEEWKKAMESELKSIEKNGTWELVELPEGRKVITSKWLFKIKPDADGKIERYKSRLEAKGYQQKEKAPRQWYLKLRGVLEEIGFTPSTADHSLFMLGEGKQMSFMVVYVDDILIFSPSSDLVKEVMLKVQDKFKCKALGDVSFYLGLHIERDVEKRCMRVHQRKYLEALAANFGQSEGHVATPFPSGFKCVKGPEEENVGEEERRRFHSLVGSLMYAAVNTRLDVAFATGQLARVVECPNEEQVAAGMRVAKYLGQTPTVGLQYSAAAQRRQKGADGGGAGAGGFGAVCLGDTVRLRPYFVPLLQQSVVSLRLVLSHLLALLVAFLVRVLLLSPACTLWQSDSASPPSVGGEFALGTDVLDDRQEDFECLAAAVPCFASMPLSPERDPDAPDIPTSHSYAEAITGPYSSQRQAAMDAKMASGKSTGTYVDKVPPLGANLVDGMWIFRVKRPPGSPPAFMARYVARGFSQRQGVDYFQAFSPAPNMTALWVLLHVASQRDYKLHSLDFSTTFLQGSLHKEIWLRRPPSFTGLFPAGTQWSLRWPVYGLHHAPREWHDTLRTTLAALGFAPSTADPLLFLRIVTSLPPFYVLVYVDDLVFATADTKALTLV
ncbi:unnamed protein product [Closterium sp. NIES-54]